MPEGHARQTLELQDIRVGSCIFAPTMPHRKLPLIQLFAFLFKTGTYLPRQEKPGKKNLFPTSRIIRISVPLYSADSRNLIYDLDFASLKFYVAV